MSALQNAQDEKKARGRAAAKAKAQEDGWRGFVNVELTADQKVIAKKLLEDPARVWDNVFSLITEGYKLTLSYDDVRSNFNLSMTCKGRGNPNAGLTLTGRGGSELAAAVSFWFKHDVILAGVWGEASSSVGGAMAADEFD